MKHTGSTKNPVAKYFEDFADHFKDNLDLRRLGISMALGGAVGAIPGLLSSCAGLVLWWQVGLTFAIVMGLSALSVYLLTRENQLPGIVCLIGTLAVSTVMTVTMLPWGAEMMLIGMLDALIREGVEGLIAVPLLTPLINLLSPILVLTGSYGHFAAQIPTGAFLSATGLYNPATAVMTLGEAACCADAICLVGGIALGALAVVLYQVAGSAKAAWQDRASTQEVGSFPAKGYA